MKIHHDLVSTVLEGMSEDISITYPSFSRASKIQLLYSRKQIECRGLQFVTLDLPAAGKWLDHCLDAGRMLHQRPLFLGRRGSTIYPKYHWYLWELIFDEEGVIRSNPDYLALFFLRTSFYFAKKLELECDQERVYASVKNYETLEENMPRSWPYTWDADTPFWGKPQFGHPIYGLSDLDRHPDLPGLFDSEGPGGQPSIPWGHLARLSRLVIASWGELDIWAIEPKHGPGAVADEHDIKYEFDSWPKRLDAIFPADWFASHDFVVRTNSEKEIGSIMHAVPKTQKGPRLIAAEPTSHQWIQGGIQRWLEGAIRSSPLGLSIDFRNQGYSQALALESSLTQEYATIDLSDASDRLSTRLVQYIFQSHQGLLDALHACRTRFINIPGTIRQDGLPRMMRLNKFSTQGSAVTFPVQTIVFTMLGHFALMCLDSDWDVSLAGMRSRAHRLRVFGDDIIIDSAAYGWLVRILTECGLKVNKDKSFYEGRFREACGMDAYDGVDITPAYIRSPYHRSKPESLASVVQCSNNFHKKGLWNTAHRILQTVAKKELSLLITSRRDAWSLSSYTFCEGEATTIANRFRLGPATHRREAFAMTLGAKSEKKAGKGEASLFQYFTEDPSRSEISGWKSGQAMRPRNSKRARWVPVG